MRLDGGVTKWEGRVEVCFNQRWNIVGGEEWSETNCHVMCNVLGYDIPGKYIQHEWDGVVYPQNVVKLHVY